MAGGSPDHSPVAGGEIARNAVWRLIEVMGSELLAFGFMVVLARLLLPSDYGVVAIASVFLMVAQMIVYHGFAEAIIQKPDLEERDAAAALWANIAIGLILSLILAALALPVAALLDKPLLGPILLAMSPITLMFGLTGIMQARIRRALALKILAIRTLVSTLVGGAIGLTMAFSDMGAWSLVGQQLSHAISGVLVLLVMTGWLPKPTVSFERIAPLVRYGWSVMLTFLLDTLSRNITTIILGYFLISELVGQFFVANRMFLSLAMLTFISVNELCLPILARLQGQQLAHHDAIHRCFQLTALICLPAYLGLALIAEPVVLTLFGENWLGAVLPLKLLCLFGVAHGFASLTSQIFLSLSHPKRAFELTFVTLILLVILVVPAAAIGLQVATFAMGMAYLLVLPYAAWRLSQIMPLDLTRLAREQGPLWLSAAAMVGTIELLDWLWLIDQAPGLQLAATIPFAALSFVVVLKLTAPALLDDVVNSLRQGLRAKRSQAV